MDGEKTFVLDPDKLFYGPKDLQHRMDLAFINEYYDSTDLIYRAYLWMLFAGMKMDDAISVQKSDVLYRGGLFVCKVGKAKYEIDRLGNRSIERALHLRSFECFAESGSKIIRRNVVRPDSDYLISGTNGKIGKEVLAVMTCRKAQAIGVPLDRKSIFYSGIFYRKMKNVKLSTRERNVVYRCKNDYLRWEERMSGYNKDAN